MGFLDFLAASPVQLLIHTLLWFLRLEYTEVQGDGNIRLIVASSLNLYVLPAVLQYTLFDIPQFVPHLAAEYRNGGYQIPARENLC